MRTLVTGGAGFLGRALTRVLVERGDEVLVLDRAAALGPDNGLPAAAQEVVCDIADAPATDALVTNPVLIPPIDRAVHLAAMAAPGIAQKQPGLTWSANAQGTFNVLHLLRRLEVKRAVFTSTAHVYGISPRYTPTDENHPFALQDTYTSSKIVGEELFSLFWKNHGLSYATLRLFNGYGPGQSRDYFVPNKIAQAVEAWKNGSRGLKLMGRRVTKDWVHVNDIVRAIVLALDSDYVGPLNVGTGVETSLEVIARQVADAFGLGLDFEGDDPGTRMQCDPRRAKTVLGWAPEVTLARGLADLIERARAAR